MRDFCRQMKSGCLMIIFVILLLPMSDLAGSTGPASDLLREMVSVPDILDVQISDDGSVTAMVREEPDWENNYYDNEIVLVTALGERALTRRSDGGSWRPRWQPKSLGLAYLQYREGFGTQLYFQATEDSEPVALTNVEGGISSFAWGPKGDSIAVIIREAPNPNVASRRSQYGEFRLAGHDLDYRHIWLLNLNAVLHSGTPATRQSASAQMRRLTGGRSFTLGGFWDAGTVFFTPGGSEIVFDHSLNSGPDAVDTQDISAVNVSTGSIRPIVRRVGYDRNPLVSPDGQAIVFETSEGPYRYFGRDHLAIAPITGGAEELITRAFSESAQLVAWEAEGIYFKASEGIDASLYRYDCRSETIEKLADGDVDVFRASVSSAGAIALAGSTAALVSELYLLRQGEILQRQTNTTAQFFTDRELPVTSIVEATAADGTRSVGVLYLPYGARQSDPPRPMLTIIHGGPKQTARPERSHAYVYPVEYWLKRGAAVFMPNYRGSAGFGDTYRSASYQNFGQGPMEDILSGLDVLVESGVADPERLGVMGWSNGGYLTAFLVSHDDRFVAASIGAGIVEWRLQYALSDDPNGSVQYLGGTPSEQGKIYAESSPALRIAHILTPTLIQHGSDDRRVPIAHAQMLYRGLRSIGTPVEQATFEGLTHYFAAPRARLAAAEQNRRWFAHYLFGEGTPDLELLSHEN